MKCGLRGEKMQSKSILRYIIFGTELRYIQDAKAGWSVHKESWILENINHFFAHLQEFNLPVTQRAAYELRQFRDELAKSDSDHKLTDDEASKLRYIMNKLRDTLFAEADGNVAFIVTDKRIMVIVTPKRLGLLIRAGQNRPGRQLR